MGKGCCDLSTDLGGLSVADRALVVRFIEDRFISAVDPLGLRLDMEMPGTIRVDPTLLAEQEAVRRVLAAVEEARAAPANSRLQRGELSVQ